MGRHMEESHWSYKSMSIYVHFHLMKTTLIFMIYVLEKLFSKQTNNNNKARHDNLVNSIMSLLARFHKLATKVL